MSRLRRSSIQEAVLRFVLCLGVLWTCGAARSAEIEFNFSEHPLDQAPEGFRSLLSGSGKAGDWKVILAEVDPLIPTLTAKAGAAVKRQVLAQLSTDPTDERFPMLIYEGETFADFKLTTRFKIVSGVIEQMAGIAFRVQDENNYYYVRASSLGNTFRFFKVVNGVRSAPIGPEVPIEQGVWHEMAVECKGNQIYCSLNGKELIPALTDNSFAAGKFGFWTKSDSKSFFADTRIVYTPRERFAAALIREALRRYPRLLGLRIYAVPPGKTQPQVVGSNEPKDVGLEGGKTEHDVIERGSIYYGKSTRSVIVTLPLHDRNGEPIAAVRVTMQSFVGQTEQNAIARALPVVKHMELRVRGSADLAE